MQLSLENSCTDTIISFEIIILLYFYEDTFDPNRKALSVEVEVEVEVWLEVWPHSYEVGAPPNHTQTLVQDYAAHNQNKNTFI